MCVVQQSSAVVRGVTVVFRAVLVFVTLSSSKAQTVPAGPNVTIEYPTETAAVIKLNARPYHLTLKPIHWNSKGGTNFTWVLVGDDDCFVKLRCSQFNLNGPCNKQNLRVTDGYYGVAVYCENNGPPKEGVMGTKGLRDLYVTLRVASGGETLWSADLECSATCVKDNKINGSNVVAAHLPTRPFQGVSAKCQCGRKPIHNRIVGGEAISRVEHPWLVALVVANTRQPYCIGALINDRMVITGAHCFQGRFRKKNNTQIVINTKYMDPMPNVHIIPGKVVYKTYNDAELARLDRGNDSYRYEVEKIIMHPLYNMTMSDYDTAVMLLSTPVYRFEGYSPVCMPPLGKNSNPDMYTGKKAEIVGWGLESVKAAQTVTYLRKIQVDIFSPESCARVFGKRIPSTKRVFCAAHPTYTEDSCVGDSGGPAISQERKIWYQVGIISWGDSCGEQGAPGVYYRTTSTNQWVHFVSNLELAIWCTSMDYPYPSLEL